MSGPRPFTFDRRFGDRRAPTFSIPEKEPVIAVAAHEARLKAACDEAHERGLALGISEAGAAETARLARALEEVAQKIAALNADLSAIENAATADAIRLAEKFAGALASLGVAAKPAVTGDPGVARGDVVIEWADGGLTRNFAQAEAELAKVAAAAVASLVPAGPGAGTGQR